MDQIFEVLIPGMLVLYSIIGIGYLLGRFVHVSSDELSNIIMYLITPALIFFAAFNVEFSLSILSIPLIIIVVPSLVESLVNFAFRNSSLNTESSVLSIMSGTKNAGYLGIPIAMIIFESSVVSIYILTIFGKTLQEHLYGMYIVSGKKFNFKNEFKMLVTLPIFIAGITGFIMNYFDIHIPSIILDLDIQVQHIYSTMGILIVGIGLSSVTSFYKLKRAFLIIPHLCQFILWPLIMIFLVSLDIEVLHFLNSDIHKVLLLYSLMPIAINCIAFVEVFDETNLKDVSFSVLISLVISFFYIPFMVYWLDLI